MIRTAVCGVGRTGSEVHRAILDSNHFQLTAAFCRQTVKKADAMRRYLARSDAGVTIREITQIEQALAETPVDVVIDFSMLQQPSLFCVHAKNPVRRLVLHHGIYGRGSVLDDRLCPAQQAWRGFRAKRDARRQRAARGAEARRPRASFVRLIVNRDPPQQKADIPSGTAKSSLRIEDERPQVRKCPSARSARWLCGVAHRHARERLRAHHSHAQAFSRRAFVEWALTAAEFIVGKPAGTTWRMCWACPDSEGGGGCV